MRGNVKEVISRLIADVDSLSFRGLGRRGILAQDVQATIARVVSDRTEGRQQQPDGAPLAPLAESTLRRKRLLGQPSTILVATGEMLSENEIQGDLEELDHHDMTMVYGQSDDARQKAEWAHRGSGRRPKRPFFAIGENEADRKAVDRTIHDGLDVQAKGRWGGGYTP